ncbi:hypothetical protein DK871_00555 [Pseudomonas sp. L13]|nr:hypothetical protein [Pseudomonas sp. L13]
MYDAEHRLIEIHSETRSATSFAKRKGCF